MSTDDTRVAVVCSVVVQQLPTHVQAKAAGTANSTSIAMGPACEPEAGTVQSVGAGYWSHAGTWAHDGSSNGRRHAWTAVAGG